MENLEQSRLARPQSEARPPVNDKALAVSTNGFAPPKTPLAIVRSHDLARRQRLVRLMALGVSGISLVLLPSVFIPTLDSVSLVALLIVCVGALAAYVINRWQRVGLEIG